MYSTTDEALAILKALFYANQESGNVSGKIKNFSSELPNLEGIVPFETFHPQLKVVIDFTSKFTLDFINEGGVRAGGERLVTTEVLIDRAKKLANFWFYYFTDTAFLTDGAYQNSSPAIISKNATVQERVDSSKAATKTYYDDLQSKLALSNEDAANEFINKVMNFFVTDIQTNRSIGNIGTCSITFRDNIQNFNSQQGSRNTIFFKELTSIIHQLFSPMLPVSVYAKGRLYTDTWFPIFTGYIFQVLPTDNSGFTNMTIACRDTLELARISSEMINPALINLNTIKVQKTIQFYTQPFYNKSTEDIAKMVFVGGTIDTIDPRPAEMKAPKNAYGYTEGFSFGITFQGLGDFSKLYSSNKTPAFDLLYSFEDTYLKNDNSIGINDFLYRLANPHNIYIWGESVTPYKLFQFSSPKHWTTQFASRFDIIKLATQFAYMDLYADVHGNIQIHPMRLANEFFDISAKYLDANGLLRKAKKQYKSAYVISPHETITSAPIFNIQDIKTFARIGGSPPEMGAPSEDWSTMTNYIGTATDNVYMKKYGFRLLQGFDGVFNYNPKINGKGGSYKFLDMVAREMLKHKNGELYTRTANIIFRPELDLANPIYFTDFGEIFYLQSISHTINIGGAATTTINGNFGRTEKESPPMLWDFIVSNEKLYVQSKLRSTPSADEIDEQTLGVNLTKYMKSEMDRYTFPFAQMDAEAQKNVGSATGTTPAKPSKNKQRVDTKNPNATVVGKSSTDSGDLFPRPPEPMSEER